MIRVHPISSAWATSYLIETEPALFLVDAGFVGHASAVLRRIESIGREPSELRFALVTHAHPDHFGGLAGLRDVATFDVGCHPLHVETLTAGNGIYSPGLRTWSRAYMALARIALRFLRFRGVSSVRPIADGESLHGIGLPGRVYYTPGHSGGCISLVLDDGTALTGDLVQGPRRAGSSPELPAMGENPVLIRDSWRRLLDKGVHKILPAHGAVHGAEDLRRALEHATA